MTNPVAAISYLTRAEALRKTGDRASLIYAALELRCGVEARLQEHAAVAMGVSKTQANQWEIKKLGRTLVEAFGLRDEMLLLFVSMEDGRSCQFVYAPVSERLQEIAMRCGDYLHAQKPERVAAPDYWSELDALVLEGCALLQLACQGDILRPSMGEGLHFGLLPDDPRVQVIKDLQAGSPGTYSVAKLTPAGPLSFYPAE